MVEARSGDIRVRGFFHSPHLFLVQQGPQQSKLDATNADCFINDPNTVVFEAELPENFHLGATREGLFLIGFPDDILTKDKPEITDSGPFGGEIFPNLIGFSIAEYFNLFFNIMYNIHQCVGITCREPYTYASVNNVLTPVRSIDVIADFWPNTKTVPTAWAPSQTLTDRTLPFSSPQARRQIIHTETLAATAKKMGKFIANRTLRAQAHNISFGRQLAQQYEFSQATIINWLVIEQSLGKIWKDTIENNRKQFSINKKRKDMLENSHDYTAAVRIEILNMMGIIPNELYELLTKVRRVRNDLVHIKRQHVTHEDYLNSAQAACKITNICHGCDLLGVGNSSRIMRWYP